METKQIDGISIISENGDFFFDSGLPETEPVIDNPATHRGTAVIKKNGTVQFKATKPSPVGTPAMETILHKGGLFVKRSSKNFIVSMKFPIFEKGDETTALHEDFWQQAENAIVGERDKIKSTF